MNIRFSFDFCFEKERKKDREENERGRDRERRLRATNPKSFFFEILSDLNQAVPNHLTDESQTPPTDASKHGLVVYPADAFVSRLRGD